MNKNEMFESLGRLAEMLNEYNLDEISVEISEFKAKMSKKPKQPPMPPQMPPMAMPVVQPAAPVVQQINGDVKVEGEKKGGKLIKSPIIGTFYASAAPGKPAFVKVGSQISKGDVVCIVESMKLMNEITSEYDGTVTEILVNDGDSLEFDQPIMRVE